MRGSRVTVAHKAADSRWRHMQMCNTSNVARSQSEIGNRQRVTPPSTSSSIGQQLAQREWSASDQTAHPLPPRGLLRVDEAAAWLGIGRTKLYPMLSHRGGEIPAVKIGSATRIPLAGLQAWLASQYEANS
jgi:excisionase family DNA binding protein